MKKNVMYHEPIYSLEDKKKVCEEAQKYVMRSDTDWGKIQRLVTGMNRTLVQVKYFLENGKNTVKINMYT